jgi:hydroxyacylglutathione hydrolase
VIDARMFTVGPVQENCYIVRRPSASTAVIVDPGDEADRILEGLRALEVDTVEAILLTHCHFDHIGAVAPLAQATGAPVYCPEIERPVLADIMSWVPPGFGPFDSYEADHTVTGGDRLSLAGLDIDVLFTPGHSPGHVTYAIARAGEAATGAGAGPAPSAAGATERALLSGDVLFQGSVGRVDLPGGDWPTLERSIGSLLRAYPPQTVVYPGHMGVTTLARERDTNPFLAELRERVPRETVAPDATAAGS